MKNVADRQNDIISIISKLDISPTMYKNAEEKYKAIATFLQECGIEANMYPQGSFAFGTVVRPNVKDPDAAYDLDFICQVKGDKNKVKPSELRRRIEDALNSSKVYEEKLVTYEECFTIEYADINGIHFKIDIVPAVDESLETICKLKNQSMNPNLLNTAIAIPKHNGDRNYSWITNNAKGFREWFDAINKPFLEASKTLHRQKIFKENSALYDSVEEIPHELYRTQLQRVIQILKYHRDVFYSRFDDGDDIKPISAILNYVVAEISKGYKPYCSVFELLEYVLNELNTYSHRQSLSNTDFVKQFGNRYVFNRVDGKWKIANPANPEDNLANKWNENSRIPKKFFRWVHLAYEDLIKGINVDDDQEFRLILENSFGVKNVKDTLGKKYCRIEMPKPIIPQFAAKPFRKS